MPFIGDSWRPLMNGEIEEAVARIHGLVDRAKTALEDHTRDFKAEVTAMLSDERGYVWHEVRRIGDHLLLDHFMNDAPIRYYRAFSYAADVTRQRGLLYVESPEWDKAMPVLLRVVTAPRD